MVLKNLIVKIYVKIYEHITYYWFFSYVDMFGSGNLSDIVLHIFMLLLTAFLKAEVIKGTSVS